METLNRKEVIEVIDSAQAARNLPTYNEKGICDDTLISREFLVQILETKLKEKKSRN